MNVLVILLAVIGLVLLIMLAAGALVAERPPEAPAEEDIAAPYREGLHAAVRMQRVAQDLEQQIYAEAERSATQAKGQP
jgi:hypothetical protein